MAEDQDKSELVPVKIKTLNQEDIIRHSKRRDRIGIVLECRNDSDSYSEEDDEEQMEEGHVLVSWYPKGHEEEIEENTLEVVDRAVEHGGMVRWVDTAKGNMKGYVIKMDVKVNVRVIGARHLQIKDLDYSEVTPLYKFYEGLVISLRSWIGIVHEVLFKLTLKLKNGARCVVEGEQAKMLVDNTDQRDEDSSFYCQLFYPGQSVSGPSRLFRDAQWINGPKPVLSANQRLYCIVEEAAISGLNVQWKDRGFNSKDTSLTEPSSIVTQQDFEHISLLDHFSQESIHIGDKAYYTLKESDINNPTKRTSNEESASNLKEQPDQKKSKKSDKCKGRVVDEADDEKLDDNDSTCSEDSGDDEDSDHGNMREERQPAAGNSGSRRSESKHQGATSANRSHAARKRRQAKRKKKRYQVPVRLVPGERVYVEIDSTSKFLTVLWQDGTKQENVSSTEVLPVYDLEDIEFFPGDFVVDSGTRTQTTPYGVIQKADHAQRTCIVKWIDKDENEGPTEVSMYDIVEHPDYTFKVGDVVLRLIDVNSSENTEHDNKQDVPPCGELLEIDNDGGIHVLWADKTVSVMRPWNLLVIDAQDYESSQGSNSSSDEEWETTSDISTEEEALIGGLPFLNNIGILDDIARRSIADLNRSTPNNPQGFNEEPLIQSDVPAEEEPSSVDPVEHKEAKTVPDLASDSAASVRFRPDRNRSADRDISTFEVIEEVPVSHKFAANSFQADNPRQFNSAIRKEIAGLRSHLPPGVLVKGFENRLDLYSILIEGPASTPYEDGVFIFDLQLPTNYPKSPPIVRYLSQCTDRLNPNLYVDGTVCVSLLDTWSGKGSEKWTSKSNLCQLILSLQALILVEEPYYNEAGYEKQKGSAEGAKNSRMYNELVLIKLLQSLESLWKTPPLVFRDEIKQYLKEHIPKLILRIYNWLGLFAPDKFLQKHSIEKIIDESKVAKPDFLLTPVSAGFCISLLRSVKSLEMTFNNAAQ